MSRVQLPTLPCSSYHAHKENVMKANASNQKASVDSDESMTIVNHSVSKRSLKIPTKLGFMFGLSAGLFVALIATLVTFAQ